MGFVEHSVSDGIEEIALYVLKEQVQIQIVLCLDNLLKLNDIGVVELLEDADFAERPLRIHIVLKCQKYFFQCVYLASFAILDFPHVTVRSAAYFLEFLESFLYMRSNTFLFVFHLCQLEYYIFEKLTNLNNFIPGSDLHSLSA